MTPRKAFSLAKAYAQKSLKIDDKLAETHNSVAAIYLYYDWNTETANKEFENAVSLNPNYVTARLWYSFCLSIQGKFDLAEEQIRSAIDNDPLSVIAQSFLGEFYYYKGNFETAIDVYKRALELDSTNIVGLSYLGLVYTQSGKFSSAEIVIQKAIGLTERKDPASLAVLGYLYAVQNKMGEVQKIIREIEGLSKDRYVHPYYLAGIYVGLGNYDKAMDLLEQGYKDKSEWNMYLGIEPILKPLHGNPRYIELLEKIGIRIINNE